MWKFKTLDPIGFVSSSYVSDVYFDAFVEQNEKKPSFDELFSLVCTVYRPVIIKKVFKSDSMFDYLKRKEKEHD